MILVYTMNLLIKSNNKMLHFFKELAEHEILKKTYIERFVLLKSIYDEDRM